MPLIEESEKFLKLEHPKTATHQRRHVGILGAEGFTNIIGTGAVTAALSDAAGSEMTEKGPSNQFDVIFQTYHAEATSPRYVLPSDLKCIQKLRQKAAEGNLFILICFIKNLKFLFIL